jgi:hypothetical protein
MNAAASAMHPDDDTCLTCTAQIRVYLEELSAVFPAVPVPRFMTDSGDAWGVVRTNR